MVIEGLYYKLNGNWDVVLLYADSFTFWKNKCYTISKIGAFIKDLIANDDILPNGGLPRIFYLGVD